MENEISKHTLKIIKSIRKPEIPLPKKITEVFLEIIIIVFAVSLAQFLEREKERSEKQRDVKAFLMGLKEDIKEDMLEVRSVDIPYQNRATIIYTRLTQAGNSSLPPDTLNYYMDSIFENGYLRPNTSRYEGFKSSGRMGDIEEKELQQDILNLYQEVLPQLHSSEYGLVELGNRLQEIYYREAKAYRDGTNNNFYLVAKPEFHNYCKALIRKPDSQIFARYQQVLTTGTKIINKIDSLYPPQGGG